MSVGNDSMLGYVVEAKWCPSNSQVLGILYSSGVVRLWNVQTNEKRDFALYMRSAASSTINNKNKDEEEDDESDMPSLSSEGHRRALAAHITHFDFLPFPSRRRQEGSQRLGFSGEFIDVPSIVFSTARSASLLMVAEVPIHFLPPADSVPSVAPLSDRATELANTRFKNGGLAYTCLDKSDADVTCIRSWLVADSRSFTHSQGKSSNAAISNTGNDHDRLDLACVAVGCANGALHVWAAGRSLNPDAPVAGRNPVASPRIVKVRSFTGGAAADSETNMEEDRQNQHRAHQLSSSSSSVNPLSVTVAKGDDQAHTSRIRAISSVPVKHPDMLSSMSLPSFIDANNVFSTSSDDGTVKLWALTRTNDGKKSNNSGSDSSSVSLSVQQLSVLPTDGVPVTALSGAAWPWFYGHGQDFHATLVPNSSRALLATGSREGCIAVYEIIVPNHIRNLHESIDNNEEDDEEEDEDEEKDIGTTTSPSFRQNKNRRLGLSSSLASRPSCRLTALAGPPVRALEPICDISISPPLSQGSQKTTSATDTSSYNNNINQYALAAASADGLLSIYDILGSATIPRVIRAGEPVSGEFDLAAGSIPAMTLLLRSAVSSSDSSEHPSSSSSFTTSAATTAYDSIVKMGPEAEELRMLAAFEAEAEKEDSIRAQGGKDALLLRSRLYANVPSTKRVVTALSTCALDSLSRAFLTCSFNDAARSTSSAHKRKKAGVDAQNDHDNDDDSDGLSSVEGALMACTGGGDLLVWPRNELPSDERMTTSSNPRSLVPLQNSTINKSGRNHVVETDDSDNSIQQRELKVNDGGEFEDENNEDATSEPPVPRAPLSRAPVMPIASSSFSASSLDDVYTTFQASSSLSVQGSSSSQPPSISPALPRVLMQTVASRARLSEVAQTLRAVREQHKSASISRARSPARSLLKIAAKDAVKSVYSSNSSSHRSSLNLDQRSGSRERLRGVSKSPVERAHRRLSRTLGVNIGVAATASAADNMSHEERGRSSFDNSFDDERSSNRSRSNSTSRLVKKNNPSIRDPSIPTLAERQAAAAAAAIGSGGIDDSYSGGHNSTSASSSHIVDGSFMSWAGLKGLASNIDGAGRVVRLGGRAVPLDATVTVAASSATVTANNTFVVGDDLHAFNDDDDDDNVPPRPRSTTNLPISPSLIHSRLAAAEAAPRQASSRYIAPIFRSPARVSASLQRAARIEERAVALDNMSLALATAAAAAGKSSTSGIPPLPVVDDHADNAASLGRTNVVAPVLGSSAAMAFEIARLEQAQFDEEGAVREALHRRRITDAVVVRTLVDRARIRSLGVDLPRVANEPAPAPGEKLSDAVDLPVHAQLYSDVTKTGEDWEEEEEEEEGDVFNDLQQEEGQNENDKEEESGDRIQGRSVFLPMGGSPTTFLRRQQGNQRDLLDGGKQQKSRSIAATDILSWGKGLRGNSNINSAQQKTTTRAANVNESRTDFANNVGVEPPSSFVKTRAMARPLLVSVGGVIQTQR